MNTILTDDERPKLPPTNTVPRDYFTTEQMEAYADAREAAVLAKLAQQEPVAVVGDVWVLNWVGGGPIAPIIEKHGIKIGDPLYAHPSPQQADRQRVPQAFTDWLCREMPPGTIISDPAWWAPKIARAMLAAAPEAPAQGSTFPADAPRNIIWNSLRPDHPVEWSNPSRAAQEGEVHYIRYDLYSDAVHAAPEAPAQGEQAAEPVRDEREPSPTAGMTLGQRILHVGGRTNAAGYVEFGSVQAVDALVRHVLRDLPDAAPVRVNAELPREADPLTQLIQRLNSTPYNLTKDECIEVAKELRAALAGTERQPLPQWQIDEIIKQHTGGFIGGMHFVHLARAIEIAHGIGGKDCPPLTQWQPIETAPKHGAVIDLWHKEFGRYAGCFWGKPTHSCGEMGRFCDSDWHSLKDGWVDEFNEQHPESEFTHWMPLPAAPDAAPEAPAQACKTDERAEFERALSTKPEARFWNATDAMFWAWQARAALARKAQA